MYLDSILDFIHSWYYYFFCRDLEPIPLDPRNVIIDDDLVSLNRVMHYYKYKDKRVRKI